MKPTETMARRLALALDHLEQAWIGKTVGIAYDIDTDTGRVKLSIEPAGDDQNTLTIHADVRDVRPGRENAN